MYYQIKIKINKLKKILIYHKKNKPVSFKQNLKQKKIKKKTMIVMMTWLFLEKCIGDHLILKLKKLLPINKP
jgi:hypothetical protein